VDAELTVPARRAPGNRDLRITVIPSHEAEQRGSGVVAENRALAAGLYCSDETALQGWARVPDGVDASVERVEPAFANSPPDRVVRETAIAKLADRDHAELPRRPSRDRSIGSSVE